MRVATSCTWLVACTAALLGLVGCKGSSATRRTEQFIPVEPGTRVQITVTTGYISVSAGRLGMVSVRTFRKVRALWNAQDKLKHIQVRVTKKDGVLIIDGTSPRNRSSRKYHMHLDVVVPPQTPLVLKTREGNIDLTNLRGDVEGSTGRGELKGRGVTGALKLSTKEGNITVRGAPRSFQLDTRLGDVRLWLRPETRLVRKSAAHTASGALTLVASPKLNALITAEARGSRLHSAFPLEGQKAQWAQVRLGRGEPAVSLLSRGGALRLKKW